MQISRLIMAQVDKKSLFRVSAVLPHNGTLFRSNHCSFTDTY